MKILLILPRDSLYRYRGLANKIIGPWAPLTLVTLAALVPKEITRKLTFSMKAFKNQTMEIKTTIYRHHLCRNLCQPRIRTLRALAQPRSFCCFGRSASNVNAE